MLQVCRRHGEKGDEQGTLWEIGKDGKRLRKEREASGVHSCLLLVVGELRQLACIWSLHTYALNRAVGGWVALDRSRRPATGCCLPPPEELFSLHTSGALEPSVGRFGVIVVAGDSPVARRPRKRKVYHDRVERISSFEHYPSVSGSMQGNQSVVAESHRREEGDFQPR